MDNQSRIALVRVGQAFTSDTTPAVKYQLGDHLGSSNLVVDGVGNLVNREEYTPYGETSFGSFARKRYRFTGKERDEESGLNYHHARYYAPWLTKWTNCDPAGTVDGFNLFIYSRNNPICFVDRQGFEACDVSKSSCVSNVASTNDPGNPDNYGEDDPSSPSNPEYKDNLSTAKGLDDLKKSTGAGGHSVSRAAPEGYTKVVPDTFSLSRKLVEYHRSVLNGEIGRNAGPGNSTETRRYSPTQEAARIEFAIRRPMPTEPAPGGLGWDIDHIIELQDDITGTKGESWRDYQWLDGRMNRAEGRENWSRHNRNYTQGAPAGGVARASDAGKWINSEGYRTTVRTAGRGLELYAAVQSAQNVVVAAQADISQGTGGVQTAKAVATEAGGWGAAVLVGGETAMWGAACGPWAPVCMPVFGLVGGGVGYYLGSSGIANLIGY
jgi:RHS repeat-associated protein